LRTVNQLLVQAAARRIISISSEFQSCRSSPTRETETEGGSAVREASGQRNANGMIDHHDAHLGPVDICQYPIGPVIVTRQNPFVHASDYYGTV
jgi:hypothetical protein